VRGAVGELRGLAERLDASVPLSVWGVAAVRVLLTDASSPLMRPGSGAELPAQVRQLRADLGPRTDWQTPGEIPRPLN